MPTYKYKTRDKSGIAISGVVEAKSQKEVSYGLKELGYKVISITEEKGVKVIFRKIANKMGGISRHEVIFFARQLGSMTHAGLTLLDAIEGIIQQTKNMRFRKILIQVAEDIKGGKSLSDAMAKYPKIFSVFFVSMVKAGETAGILDQMLERVSAIGLADIDLKSRVRAAMIYPVLLVFVSVAIVTFLLTVVLPKFITIFEESGAKLPLPTLILLALSGFLRRFGIFILAGCVIFTGYIIKQMRSEKGKYKLHDVFLRVPVMGDIVLKVTVARLFRALGALTKSGIPLMHALEVSKNVINNKVFIRALAHVREAVGSGGGLSTAMRVTGVFPTMAIQMISVGEKTGSLDNMFIEVSDFYDKELDYTIRGLTTMLEPMLLLVMGGFVGFIALSVLLPIFNLVKVFKR